MTFCLKNTCTKHVLLYHIIVGNFGNFFKNHQISENIPINIPTIQYSMYMYMYMSLVIMSQPGNNFLSKVLYECAYIHVHICTCARHIVTVVTVYCYCVLGHWRVLIGRGRGYCCVVSSKRSDVALKWL